jgi:hypothetical protein
MNKISPMIVSEAIRGRMIEKLVSAAGKGLGKQPATSSAATVTNARLVNLNRSANETCRTITRSESTTELSPTVIKSARSIARPHGHKKKGACTKQAPFGLGL